MPRNEDVFPSCRPRSFPPLTWTTGGFTFSPFLRAPAADGFRASCHNSFPATPTTAPTIKAVAVPSSSRRFIRTVECCDDSYAIAVLSVEHRHQAGLTAENAGIVSFLARGDDLPTIPHSAATRSRRRIRLCNRLHSVDAIGAARRRMRDAEQLDGVSDPAYRAISRLTSRRIARTLLASRTTPTFANGFNSAGVDASVVAASSRGTG